MSVRVVHLTVVSRLNYQEPGECTCVCQLNLLASASNNRNWDKQIICIYHRLPSCQYVVWEKTFAPRMCPHFVLSCYNVSTFCVVLLKCVHVCDVLLKSAFFSIFRVYGSCRNYNLVSCMHFLFLVLLLFFAW